MSAAVETYRDDLEATYAVDFTRDREPIKARKRFPEYRRKGGAPSRVSGMHCRRNKRWTWGSGRGARMLNTRAFASCVAFAVASLAATAFGAPMTIDMVTVGNPGNPGISVTQPQVGGGTLRPNTGAVADIFRIGKYETTNSQYAAFLQAVDPTGSNPNQIYDAQMTTDVTNGGITFMPGTGYMAKPGFESKPVTYTSWFSAARFVNWLAGGQRTGAQGQADMNGGFAGSAYTLGNATSGPMVARNSGATYFLPSLDEWYKAAYYSGAGSTYWTYGTQSNTAPLASTQVSDQSLANVANYGSPTGNTTGVVDVGFYTVAQSAYGVFGAYGNMVEYTDSTQPGNTTRVMGGGASWKLGTNFTANWSGSQIRYLPSGVNDSYGFRVAAVPEPSTIVMAGVGLAGLAGLELRRRRRTAC